MFIITEGTLFSRGCWGGGCLVLARAIYCAIDILALYIYSFYYSIV